MKFSVALSFIALTVSALLTFWGVVILLLGLSGPAKENAVVIAALVTVPPHFVAAVVLDALYRVERGLAVLRGEASKVRVG